MDTQRHLRGHEQCRACGPDGFLIEGPPQDCPGGLTVETCFSEAHQGWIQVPHGGIGMALVLELARSQAPDGAGYFIDYPFRGSFRWGGPVVSIGEKVAISIEPQAGGIRGGIWKAGGQDSFPYLSAVLISCAVEPETVSSRALSLVEALGTDLKNKAFQLPRYRECFVCGVERQAPGLRSTFYLIQHEQNNTNGVFSFHGLDPDDEDNFYWLRISDKELHPGVVASVMDEVMGWSGFVTCKQGGVTVKIEIDFLRPVSPGERLLCCGRCTHVKGRDPRRQFWFSEAMVIPLLGDDHVPVAVGRGQWLTVPMLTEEMKSNLLPRSAVSDLFS